MASTIETSPEPPPDVALTQIPHQQPPPSAPRWRERLDWRALVLLLLATGVVLRFVAISPLWLDEAQSVNIAKLPLHALLHNLRHDGSPPLYYLLLHGWIALFGDSDFAVRTLSSIASVAALPLLWVAGNRIAGRRAAWTAVTVVATSPFAIRYGSETRMYSFVLLEVVCGMLAIESLWRRPSRKAFCGLVAVTVSMLLTHYWSLYVLGSVGGVLLWQIWRQPERRAAARRCVYALLVGLAICLPWGPIFVWQAQHTGAPWAPKASMLNLVNAVFTWASSTSASGLVLAVIMIMLGVVALFGRPAGGPGLVLRRPARPLSALLGAAWLMPLVVGIAVAILGFGAWTSRYTIVTLAPFALLVGIGVATFETERTRAVLVVTMASLGLIAAIPGIVHYRTEAGSVATKFRQQAHAGDIVAYCPDQLGPAVSRLAPPGLVQYVYPTLGPPQIVDWADYAKRNQSASPREFVNALLRRSKGHTIWFVESPDYRTFGNDCERITGYLAQARPDGRRALNVHKDVGEVERLYFFPLHKPAIPFGAPLLPTDQ